MTKQEEDKGGHALHMPMMSQKTVEGGMGIYKRGSNQLSSCVGRLIHAENKEYFDSILDELMKAVYSKESILDSLRKFSQNWDDFERYILNDTAGICGKVTNSPDEQNHASIVANAGRALYKDPAFEI